jgi:hypothetical protein
MEQKIISEYLRRSYFALDGLWFMMIEDKFSFDKAMEIDVDVWRVLPKIQARKVKELLNLKGNGLADFTQAIKVKMEAEEYDYAVKELDADHIQITISKCPWYEILKRAKREHLSQQIADEICCLEYKVWLREFGENLCFTMKSRCCTDDPACLLDFRAE